MTNELLKKAQQAPKTKQTIINDEVVGLALAVVSHKIDLNQFAFALDQKPSSGQMYITFTRAIIKAADSGKLRVSV